MERTPTSVWNEVRFTNEGISISLFSESPDSGAILEDEMWYTYDELQEMAPSEPMSLNLSSESREALSEMRNNRVVANLALPSVGELAIDTNAPDWSNDDRLRVVGISDKSADEYVVEERLVGHDKTVADVNPSADPDETVVEARYLDENGQPSGKTYAFPVSRLEW